MRFRSILQLAGLAVAVLLVLLLLYDIAALKAQKVVERPPNGVQVPHAAPQVPADVPADRVSDNLASWPDPGPVPLFLGRPPEPPDDTQRPDGYVISGTWHAQYTGLYAKTEQICNDRPVYRLNKHAVVWHGELFRWFVAPFAVVSADKSCCECGFDQAVLKSNGGGCPESLDGPGCQGVWLERRVPDCILQEADGWCHQHKVRASASNGDGCKKHDCSQHGTCVALGTGHKCDCLYGWHGDQCQIDCSRGGCPVMVISGTHHPEYSGRYFRTSNICNNKPAYQNGEYALYYDMANEWNVGSAARAKDCDVRAEPGFLYLGGQCYEDTPDGDMCKGSFWYEMDVPGCTDGSPTGWCPREQVVVKAATGQRRQLDSDL